MMEEFLAAVKEKEYNSLNSIFGAWMKEAGVRGIQVNIDRGEVIHYTIFTSKPGFMIGYKGELADKYKQKLKEYEFMKKEVIVHFIETKYSFVLEKDKNETA